MAYRTIKPVVLDNAADVSADYVGVPFSIEGYDRCSLKVVLTGTMTGTLTVQASNDYVPPGASITPSVNPPDWVDIPLVLNPVIGVDQGYFIDFTSTGMPWLRVNYTSTGGAGVLTSVITAKEF